MLRVSGSKSQLGSGCPSPASVNSLEKDVTAPIATFLQKSGPSMALKLLGSHSSRATICAIAGCGVTAMVVPCAIARLAQRSNAAPKNNFILFIVLTILSLGMLGLTFSEATLAM